MPEISIHNFVDIFFFCAQVGAYEDDMRHFRLPTQRSSEMPFVWTSRGQSTQQHHFFIFKFLKYKIVKGVLHHAAARYQTE